MANSFLGRVVVLPPAIQVDGVEEFEVNYILDSRFRRRKLEYYVDWVSYDVSKRSWEPGVTSTNASEAIQDFHRICPSRHNLMNECQMWEWEISKIINQPLLHMVHMMTYLGSQSLTCHSLTLYLELGNFFGEVATLQSRERVLRALKQTGSVSDLAIQF